LLAVLEKIVGPPDPVPVPPEPEDDSKPPVNKEKKNVKAIVGLAISGLLLLTLLSESFTDYDSFIGALVIALIGLIFGIIGWYDVKLKKVGGRGLAIGSIVCAVLVVLMLVGQFSSEPATVYPGSPELPAPTVAPKRANPRPMDISGSWLGNDGMTYTFEQDGNTVLAFGFNQFGAPMMNGHGLRNGSQPIQFNYSLADGSSGQFTLQIAAGGQTMNADYVNQSTGESGRILLSRQMAGY